ncbi:MAG TPA: serine hydrolase [Blastocatellia bacterium]|nr:serine hydrolase [Blastocatellia bacterium]
MRQRVIILFLCIVISTMQALLAAPAKPQADFAEIEKAAIDELKETNTPGAMMMIISGDRVVFSKGLGSSDADTGAAMTDETLVRIDVLSKFLAATILVSLADEGKIDLKMPIGNYVKGLNARLANVTAHQLLTQTAGIAEDHVEYPSGADPEVGKIVRAWKDSSFFAEPGKIYSYSNPGYAPVRLLIDEIGGKPFAEQLNERIFKPMGMTRSTSDPMVAVTYPFTQSHRGGSGQGSRVIRPLSAESVGWPGSLMFSNLKDVSRFLIAFMNGGKLEGRQVLSPSVIATLSKPYVPYPATAGEEEGYGIHFYNVNGRKVMGTGTSWGGVVGYLRMFPEEKFAMVILTNGGRPLRKTTDSILQMFFPAGAHAIINSPHPMPLAESEASNYVGTYSNERTIQLLIQDGKLFLREQAVPVLGSVTGGYNTALPVTKIGDHFFSITPNGAAQPTVFALIAGDDGKAEFMHIGGRALKRK